MDKDITVRNTIVNGFESKYLDFDIKSRHQADCVNGHEKRGIALKQCRASVVK